MAGEILQRLIKESAESLSSEYSLNLGYGEITKINPLVLKINNLEITKEFIEIAEEFKVRTVGIKINIDGEIKNTTAILDNSLKVGEKVVVLQSDKDGMYYILSRG